MCLADADTHTPSAGYKLLIPYSVQNSLIVNLPLPVPIPFLP